MQSFLRSIILSFILFSTVFADTGSTKLFSDGFELLRQNKYTEAAKKFETGLKSDPKNALGHYYLGEAYLGQGKKDKALQQFQKSLDVDPNSTVSGNARQKIAEFSEKPKPSAPANTPANKVEGPTEKETVEFLNGLLKSCEILKANVIEPIWRRKQIQQSSMVTDSPGKGKLSELLYTNLSAKIDTWDHSEEAELTEIIISWGDIEVGVTAINNDVRFRSTKDIISTTSVRLIVE